MNELMISLDLSEKKHLYEQIYQYIRDEIHLGHILTGEKLPSARALAEQLQVSRCTVNFAYEQLLSEGYIEAKPCKGYYVCPIEELFAWGNENKAADKHLWKTETAKQEPAEQIDFSPHAVDIRLFPFETWRRISRKVLMESNSDVLSLGHPQGDLSLRKTIARYLYQARGVNCSPEQIVVGAGNDYLLMLLHQLLGENVSVAMENPTYFRAYRMFRSFGFQIRSVPMDSSGILVEQLKNKNADVVYVMPSHQFPVGTVMPIGRRMELLNWAGQQQNRYLIEDDYDSEFRFRGKPIPALQASDTSGKVIYIGTFSKSIAPAIRTSYMVLPESLLAVFQEKCGFLSATVSRVDQAVLTEFIETGAFERHLNKMRKYYREKHDLLLQELRPLQENFQISGTDAGLHVLLSSKQGITEKNLIQKARQEDVVVYGLSEHALEDEISRSSSVLLGFGALTEKQIREGVRRLIRIWK